MKDLSKEKGVSVVICCYNSADRLYPTLKALSKQVVDSRIPWEIIIVDNASDDNTEIAAAEIWRSFLFTPCITFLTVKETLPGLVNARKKGLLTASYTYILFCDDDNWLSENYVQGVYTILNEDSSIAACGGIGIPVFETEKPFWFDIYSEAYAVGSQLLNNESERQLNLYGAGLAINRTAIEKLEKTGFQPQMTGRTGKSLASAEDTELTYAFVLMEYKLHFAEELQFFHYLPKERLNFDYLKKIFTAFGTDGPIRNLYYAHISKRPFHRFIKYWAFHFLLSLFRLIKYLVIPPKKYGRTIYFNWSIAYIKQLFFIKRNYRDINKNIQVIKRASSAKKLKVIHKYNMSPL
jgi:glycosyltransferase involved in cell wall biosynthesis